jgi:hypothetical protein
MGEVSDPGGEERLGGRSRGRMRGCVLLGGPHFTHPLSPGEKKIASKKGKIFLTLEKILKKEEL